MRAIPVALAAATLALPGHAAIDWQADVEFLCGSLPTRHVAPFHTISRAEWDARCASLARIAASFDDAEAVAALAELVAAVGDGHTRVTLPIAPAAGLFPTHTPTAPAEIAAFHQLPIRVEALVDGYLVTRAAPALSGLLGTRLTRLGSLPVDQAVNRLRPMIHGDNEAQRRRLSASFLVVPELLRARGLIDDADEIRCEFELSNGTTESVRLEAVPSSVAIEWLTFAPTSGLPRYLQSADRDFWFERLPGSKFVYARVAQLRDQSGVESLTTFTERLFASLAGTGEAGLIIDLRGNPGGDNTFAAAFVRGMIRDRRLELPGRSFVIIDGETFSAAMTLATELERWTPAVFVGEESGGSPNGFGDARRMTLPQSGLTVRVSTLYWQTSVPTDERDAIIPLLAAPITLADRRAGRDSALEAIRALDAAPARVAGVWHGTLAIAQRLTPVELLVTDDADAGSLAGTFSAPELGVTDARWRGTRGAAGELTGRVILSRRHAGLRARATDERLIGTVEYLGSSYPFVATRQNGFAMPSRATVAMPIQ